MNLALKNKIRDCQNLTAEQIADNYPKEIIELVLQLKETSGEKH